MEIQPIGERVLLKPLREEEKTASGIYLPESAREAKKQGLVAAVGTMKDGEFPVKKGDRVLYGGYSHEEFELEGEEYVIVELKDIAARLI